jgi:hypothetical protein
MVAVTTSQGAVRVQSNAENEAARSASTRATLPGMAPADISSARYQAVRPIAIKVFNSVTINKGRPTETSWHAVRTCQVSDDNRGA